MVVAINGAAMIQARHRSSLNSGNIKPIMKRDTGLRTSEREHTHTHTGVTFSVSHTHFILHQSIENRPWRWWCDVFLRANRPDRWRQGDLFDKNNQSRTISECLQRGGGESPRQDIAGPVRSSSLTASEHIVPFYYYGRAPPNHGESFGSGIIFEKMTQSIVMAYSIHRAQIRVELVFQAGMLSVYGPLWVCVCSMWMLGPWVFPGISWEVWPLRRTVAQLSRCVCLVYTGWTQRRPPQPNLNITRVYNIAQKTNKPCKKQSFSLVVNTHILGNVKMQKSRNWVIPYEKTNK